MATNNRKVRGRLKYVLIACFIVLIAAALGIWFVFTKKFSDTAETKADYTFNATDLIHEFEKDDRLANSKYAEKVIIVNGIISAAEAADTTMNLKITDPVSGSYIIFAFQNENMAESKKIKEGDSVSIKGSCSGGIYSKILEAESINFKRCVLNK